MREIKFRGKQKNVDEWVYGYLYHDAVRGERIITDGIKCFEVDPETVGQYTGLKDKNGKEIYEGDILLDDDGFSNSVYMDARYAGWCVSTYFEDGYIEREWLHEIAPDYVEVIGNIYENPDLLGA